MLYNLNKTNKEMKNNGDIDVGKFIRKLRIEKDLTLQNIADKTNLSIGYLSNVERGINSSTISSLRKILNVLNISIPELFSKIEPEKVVVKKTERVRLYNDKNNDIKYELLVSNIRRKMEPMIVTIKPGACSGKEPHNHFGEEFGHIIKGELTYWIDEKYYKLEEGDTIYYSAELPHRYLNNSNDICISLWCVSPPSF